MTVNLAEVPVEDLVAELLVRPGIVASVWNIEDAVGVIADDEICADLTEDQVAAAAAIFLDKSRRGLQDALGTRGNDYLSDYWGSQKADVLAEVLAELVEKITLGLNDFGEA